MMRSALHIRCAYEGNSVPSLVASQPTGNNRQIGDSRVALSRIYNVSATYSQPYVCLRLGFRTMPDLCRWVLCPMQNRGSADERYY